MRDEISRLSCIAVDDDEDGPSMPLTAAIVD